MQRATERASVAGASRAGKAAAGTVSRVLLAVLGTCFRVSARHPTLVVTSLAVMGGAGIFAWNATMQQTMRHPAPLLAGTKPVLAKADQLKRAEVSTPTTTGAVPVPPPRPSGPDAIGSIIRAAEAPTEPKPRAAEAKPRPAESKPKAAEAKPAAPAEAKRASQPRVASAQKALAKLGYGPVTADGLMGSGTRTALEKFERDKKLPVTGELSPRTVKQLASLSGITIQ